MFVVGNFAISENHANSFFFRRDDQNTYDFTWFWTMVIDFRMDLHCFWSSWNLLVCRPHSYPCWHSGQLISRGVTFQERLQYCLVTAWYHWTLREHNPATPHMCTLPHTTPLLFRTITWLGGYVRSAYNSLAFLYARRHVLRHMGIPMGRRWMNRGLPR